MNELKGLPKSELQSRCAAFVGESGSHWRRYRKIRSFSLPIHADYIPVEVSQGLVNEKHRKIDVDCGVCGQVGEISFECGACDTDSNSANKRIIPTDSDSTSSCFRRHPRTVLKVLLDCFSCLRKVGPASQWRDRGVDTGSDV